ncbi:MAG: DUF5131 family protein [Deltaproteobacteria bacterium]|nr:DUF5131 family protein [Deltaproteobacteria bacterium]
MLIKQGKNKISWTDFTWNPISGCLHDCHYCYMKKIENRFKNGIMKPKFHEDRLNDVSRSRSLKPGDKIFVCSSGDMFGEWNKPEDIERVLEVVRNNPDYIFQFLTKNPKRYVEFNLPENGWYGTTVDGTFKTIKNFKNLLLAVEHRKRFISFEPLKMLPFVFSPYLSYIHWFIIGADSTPGVKKPPKEWADNLILKAKNAGIPVHIKSNYGYPEVIQEFPEVRIISKLDSSTEKAADRLRSESFAKKVRSNIKMVKKHKVKVS